MISRGKNCSRIINELIKNMGLTQGYSFTYWENIPLDTICVVIFVVVVNANNFGRRINYFCSLTVVSKINFLPGKI